MSAPFQSRDNSDAQQKLQSFWPEQLQEVILEEIRKIAIITGKLAIKSDQYISRLYISKSVVRREGFRLSARNIKIKLHDIKF